MKFEWLHDGLSGLLWLMIWLGIAWVYQKRNKPGGKEQKLFWLAFLLKVLAGLSFGLYFMVVQHQGDAYEYFHCLQLLWTKVEADPALFFQFLGASPGDASLPYHIYFTQGSPLAMIKVVFVLSAFAFNSFWGMSICLSGLVFFASWHVFKTWRMNFDSYTWWGAFCLFFLPSVLFWGSGLGKDGVLWLAILMVLGGLLKVYRQTSFHTTNAIQIGLIGLGSFLIAFLKAPLIGMIMLAILTGMLVSKINPFQIRKKVSIYAGLAVLILLVLFWQQRFFVELLAYQQWHTGAFEEGLTAYNLPEIKRIRELLVYLPYLAASGLFRPAPWEWGHPLVTMGGIEILAVLVAIGYWIWQKGIRFLLQSLFKNPFAVSLLVFALCLSVASMLFSQNFGTLLRYRMPALVLFLLSFWPMKENN